MQTIHLDPAMVPAALRGSYNGKKFKARICTEITIPADAGLWSGGSRDTYSVIHFETGRTLEPIDHNAAPWGASRKDVTVKLEPGIAVVLHSMFCGKDMGLTYYVHPDNAAKLLPAMPETLSDHESIVLNAVCAYKSSYGGRDRYDMAKGDAYGEANAYFPTRTEWQQAKETLIAKGLLNKAGAVTPKGRNARPSHY